MVDEAGQDVKRCRWSRRRSEEQIDRNGRDSVFGVKVWSISEVDGGEVHGQLLGISDRQAVLRVSVKHKGNIEKVSLFKPSIPGLLRITTDRVSPDTSRTSLWRS